MRNKELLESLHNAFQFEEIYPEEVRELLREAANAIAELEAEKIDEYNND